MNDDDAPRHAKRKRPDDGEDAPAAAPTRSDIWYDDGNIILQAENTQLCVHRGVLSKSSGVFRDMFAVGQPGSQSEDLVDGVPVVHLSDSRKDLEWVLRALYGDRRYTNKKDNVPLAMIAAYVRLGIKYGFENLYCEGVQFVLELLPPSLQEWDADSTTCSVDDSDLDNITFSLANLCTEADIQIALPAALYWCSIQHLEDLMTGWVGGTGHVTKLSPSALERAVIGKGKLEKQTRLQVFGYLREEGQAGGTTRVTGCTSQSSCRRARKHCFYTIFSTTDDLPDAFDKWNDDYAAKLCARCSKAAKEHWTQERQKVWDDLPLTFNLPSWEQLKKDPYPEVKNQT